MTVPLPRSLFGQTLAIIVVGLALSQCVGAWFYATEREDAVRAVGGRVAAQRMANLAGLLDDSPAEARPRIVQALNEPGFRVALSEVPPTFDPAAQSSRPALAIGSYLADVLGLPAQNIRVALAAGVPPLSGPGPDGSHWRRGFRGEAGMGIGMGHRHMMGGLGGLRDLSAAIRLGDGQWVTFSTGLSDQAPARSWHLYASLAVMALTVLAASAWAVARAVAPLRLLSAAAERLGRDVAAAPLAETGPAEMRRAVRTFNGMQDNLRRLVEGRGRLLAALSHDLRTPLTLLRLRIEGLDRSEDRERLLATVAGMEEMVATTLDFARQTALSAPRRPTDLAALVASIVDDMADAGLAVTLTPAASVVCEVQAPALRRAITNLIDNALKYGGRAEVAVERIDSQVRIAVGDHGPGLPEAELERVFEPFYRVEPSRSPETGGAGLGLSIAQSVVQAHGGRLRLANRPDGGLMAEILLPAPVVRVSSSLPLPARRERTGLPPSSA